VWNFVIPHFTSFLGELFISKDVKQDAEGKAERVARSLHARYYPNQEFTRDCYLKVGSYGRGTACTARTDLDMLFILPDEVCGRVSNVVGNKQSYLLREVKDALTFTFPRTNLRADGQVILAPFDTYDVEVVPAFRLPDGTFLTANTADGGSWRVSNPAAEYNFLHTADTATDWKATRLTIMAKTWKSECNVELKSTSIEVLASIFVSQWAHRDRDIFWYDWMIRDFFAFLSNYANGWTRIVGTENIIQLGNEWQTKLETAYNRALKACAYEHSDQGLLAALEWQKIFGDCFKTTMHRLPSLMAVGQ
jgi:Second Messenger Oligonucleotide or Dinucleotide Synthetase domain